MSDINECVRGSNDTVANEKVFVSSIGNVHLIQSRENTIANRVVYNGPITIHQEVRSDRQPGEKNLLKINYNLKKCFYF